MAQTQHVWTASKFQRVGDIDDATVLIRAKTEEFHTAGKVDTVMAEIIEDPDNDQFTSTRTFVDRAAAQEWVDFMDQFGPISATITD